MLSAASSQLNNSALGLCNGPCDLSISRGCPNGVCSYVNDRRIGFRNGSVNGYPPYADNSVPGTGQTGQNSGIINCPNPSSCPGAFTSDYVFKIERISRGMVYARYSFELSFPSSGDWIVFFEGCCRVPYCAPGSACESAGAVSGVANNAGLPFHIRTGVTVGPDLSLPSASFRFETPDLVVLRWNGVPPPGSCVVPSLPSNTISFQAQGYHPDTRFAGSVRFRIGTAYEQGLYKCVEHRDPTNPATPLVRADLVGLPARCATAGSYPVLFAADGTPTVPAATDNAAAGFGPYSTPAGVAMTPPVSIDPASGLVTFPVATVGVWQVTLVAETCLCTGGCAGGACARRAAATTDFLVSVRDAQTRVTNPHPPEPDYSAAVGGAPVGLAGVAGSAPQTIPLYPTPDSGYYGTNPYLSAGPEFHIQVRRGLQVAAAGGDSGCRGAGLGSRSVSAPGGAF